jgi:hypothetical protein
VGVNNKVFVCLDERGSADSGQATSFGVFQNRASGKQFRLTQVMNGLNIKPSFYYSYLPETAVSSMI